MENNKNIQLSFAFIDRQVENNHVHQRLLDGYINATALCKASGKQLGHYLSNTSTKAFLDKLSSVIGIPITDLVQIIRGGVPEFQGTWVHPQVAINLAQWASPDFAVLVSGWVFEWMQGNFQQKSNLPYHIKRYLLNRSKIPVGYFSVFNELVQALIAPLEEAGYELPDRLVPDISEAKIFCNWLRNEKEIDPTQFPTYEHEYADGRIVQARLYPDSLLPDFRAHFNDVWLLERAQKYFEKKDATALPYLEKIVLQLPQSEQAILLPKTFDGKIKRALSYDPHKDKKNKKNKDEK